MFYYLIYQDICLEAWGANMYQNRIFDRSQKGSEPLG